MWVDGADGVLVFWCFGLLLVFGAGCRVPFGNLLSAKVRASECEWSSFKLY
jgi:hypothetical protein